MSQNMLSQMQEIFKFMVNMQKKLDFELAERKKRSSQIKED